MKGPRTVTRYDGGKRSGPYTVGKSSSHVPAVSVGKRSPGAGTGPRSVSSGSRGSGSGPTCGGGGMPNMTKGAYNAGGGGSTVRGGSAMGDRPRTSPKGRHLRTEKE